MLRQTSPASADCRRSGGFALIVVLWTLVLIGFIVAHLSASGRTEIRIAGNLVANSASQAAADGAIFEAIFNLSDPQPEQRWPVDGTLSVPGYTGRVTRAYLMANPKTDLTMKTNDGGLLIQVPSSAPDPIATVIVLEVAR